jgi:hypothetical protein
MNSKGIMRLKQHDVFFVGDFCVLNVIILINKGVHMCVKPSKCGRV